MLGLGNLKGEEAPAVNSLNELGELIGIWLGNFHVCERAEIVRNSARARGGHRRSPRRGRSRHKAQSK
jgi:hypothetical protein